MGLDWGGLGSVATAGMGLAKKGIDNYQDLKNNQLTDDMNNTKSQLAGDEPGSNLAHANHPVWDFISKLGGGNQPAPAPNGMLPGQGTPNGSMLQGIPTQFPAAQMGAPIAPAPSPVMQMAQGGIVEGNYGHPTLYPSFVQGPMQGIRPASTRGQILTMADGGYVPGAEISVPMNGRGAAAIAGLQAGQNIGHNFQQQWQDNEARERAGIDAANTQLYGVGNTDKDGKPIPYEPPESAIGKATDAVEEFAKHIWLHTLGAGDKPHKDQPGQQGAIATNDPTQAGNQLNAPGTADPTTAGNRIFPTPGQPATPTPFPSDNKGTPLPGASQVSALPGAPPPSIKDRQIQLTQQLRDGIAKGNDSLSTMGFPPEVVDQLAAKLGITASTKFTVQEAAGLAGQLLENSSNVRQGGLSTPASAPPAGAAAPGGMPGTATPAGAAPADAAPASPAAAAPGGMPGTQSPSAQGSAGAAPGGMPGAATTGAAAAASGSAAPAAGQAAASAATGSGAAGIQTKENFKAPDTVDGEPHSWKTQWWADSNRKLADAAYYGAKAGQDPWKILASGEAQRTAHFQGEVLRITAGAVNAYQSGDMEGVARALHNINFYLPDGKGIEVSRATADQAKAELDRATAAKGQPAFVAGDLLHSNPYKGMYGYEKSQDWIKVDLPYLQSLGHGALDSDLMQKTLMERYAASAKAESEIRTGRGAELRGGGINMSGAAAEVKAGDERALLPARENLLNEQAGQASRSPEARTAAANGAPPKMTWSVYNATKNHTAALADSLQLGQKVPVPEMIPDPRHPGKMIPNTDYAPGKMMLDSSKIPPVLRGISDEDRPRLNSMAGEFHAANMGRISDYDAIDLAARVIKDQRAAPKDRVHEDPSSVKPPNAPGSGKKLKNVIHSSDGRVHIWVGPGPMDYKTIRERADHDYGNPGPGIPVDSGSGPGATSGGGGGGMGDDPDNTAMLDASSGP